MDKPTLNKQVLDLIDNILEFKTGITGHPSGADKFLRIDMGREAFLVLEKALRDGQLPRPEAYTGWTGAYQTIYGLPFRKNLVLPSTYVAFVDATNGERAVFWVEFPV